jgi:hypothetical protein
VVGLVAPGGGRVARHAHMLGILWIAYSALILLGAVVLFVISHTIFGHWERFGAPGPAPPMFVGPLLTGIGVLLACKGALGIMAGVGLLQRQSWARVLAIVLGIIGLFSVPFGTALGIYTLWVLLSPNADTEYRQLSVASS